MDNWDELRTAYQVARLGTVSGAAEVLGVHHATVIRHIDALEGRMGVKLFQRHSRGIHADRGGARPFGRARRRRRSSSCSWPTGSRAMARRCRES